MTFGMFWLKKVGSQFANVLTLVGTGGLAGVGVGLIFVVVLGALFVQFIRMMGGKATMRNAMAVVAYSCVPIVLSLFFVFPLEIAIFGTDFFGLNPPPMVINPGVYMALLAFDGLAVVWALVLLYHGVTVLTGFHRAKSIAVTALTALVPGALSFGLKFL